MKSRRFFSIFVVCLLVLAGIISLPVQADVSHRYQMQKGKEWKGKGTIPYGSVVLQEGSKQYLYKIVTGVDSQGKITPWGLVGRGLSSNEGTKVSFNWGDDYLEPRGNDIAVLYDNSNVASERQVVKADSSYVAKSVYKDLNDTNVTDGGAIYSSENILSIVSDFISNYVDAEKSSVHGGAISVGPNTTIGNIQGDFIGNYATSVEWHSCGGAIYANAVDIGDITGDFVGNYADSTDGSAYGGAIYSYRSEIDSITGDFIANHSSSCGGAIYNDSVKGTSTIRSIIGNITGNFIANYAKTNGGAIFNETNGKIETITGNFIGNYASYGGAIYNEGTIDSLVANFNANYAKNAGGAIYCSSYSSSFGSITGDFTGNFVTEGDGGAIYFSKGATKIKGDFTGNYAVSALIGDTKGGAIYNDGKISDLTGNFKNNYAKSLNDSAYGGAIYNKDKINLFAIFDDITFSGNYVKAAPSGVAQGGAIYNSSSGVINLCTKARHSITFTGDDNNSVVDSVHNDGVININDSSIKTYGGAYTGTVNFKHITSSGITSSLVGEATINIKNGTVNFYGDVTQKKITINDAELNFIGNNRINIEAFSGSGSVNITDNSTIIGNIINQNCGCINFTNYGSVLGRISVKDSQVQIVV